MDYGIKGKKTNYINAEVLVYSKYWSRNIEWDYDVKRDVIRVIQMNICMYF